MISYLYSHWARDKGKEENFFSAAMSGIQIAISFASIFITIKITHFCASSLPPPEVQNILISLPACIILLTDHWVSTLSLLQCILWAEARVVFWKHKSDYFIAFLKPFKHAIVFTIWTKMLSYKWPAHSDRRHQPLHPNLAHALLPASSWVHNHIGILSVLKYVRRFPFQVLCIYCSLFV